MKPIGGVAKFTSLSDVTGEVQQVLETPQGLAYARPWVLTIPSAYTAVGETTQYPNIDTKAFWSGIDPDWDTQAPATQFNNGMLAVRVDYGFGGAFNRVSFDHIPGVYNIPPSDFVRVALHAKGIPQAPNDMTYRLALAPGVFAGARVPTCTGVHTFAGAGSQSISVVHKAKAYDYWPTVPANVTAAQVGGNYGNRATRRDSLNGIYWPPWNPIDVDEREEAVISVTVTAACNVVFRYYLGL